MKLTLCMELPSIFVMAVDVLFSFVLPSEQILILELAKQQASDKTERCKELQNWVIAALQASIML
jgi:hypothetical protein